MTKNLPKRNVAVNCITALIRSLAAVLDGFEDESPTIYEIADLPEALVELGFYVDGPTLIVPMDARGYSIDFPDDRDPIVRYGSTEYVVRKRAMLFVDHSRFSRR
jgi:hypothetical protein